MKTTSASSRSEDRWAVMWTKPNRPFVILFIISLVASLGSILFSVHLIQDRHHEQCTILALRVLENVPRPTDPADQAAELRYRRHLAYIKLAKEVGCKPQ